jgi:hypothetical protein
MITAKTSKRLQTTQAQLQEISYALEHNQETSFDIQSVVLTIQIRYRLFKTLEFLRYESC